MSEQKVVSYEKSVKSLSDEELIERYKELYTSIMLSDVYSSSDVVLMLLVEEELNKRGYVIEFDLHIHKNEDATELIGE